MGIQFSAVPASLDLSETWLDSTVTVPDGKTRVSEFQIYRNKQGGGIIMYASEDVKCVKRQDSQRETGLELCALEVKLRKNSY